MELLKQKRKKTIFLLCLSLSVSCFSQHTKSYLDFANDFIFLDSSKVETKWKNGTVKELKNIVVIEHNNRRYECLTGEFFQFNRKGIKRTKSLFDKYGNYLHYSFFDIDGNIIQENSTIKIDFNKEADLVEITIHEKEYIKTKNDFYLYKEGNKLNGKKIGKWFTYDCQGNIVKEKKYSY